MAALAPTLDSIVKLAKLAHAIEAMCRLNSFARSNACYGYTNLRSAIYRLKETYIRRAGDANALACEKIVVAVVKCQGCSGTGIYNDRGVKCYRCKDGQASLYFKETIIGKTLMCLDWPLEDIRWHTPISNRGVVDAEPVKDWKPREPGRDLTVEELCAGLNIAETNSYNIPLYGLQLGSVHGQCALCSFEADLVGHGVTRGQLSWSVDVCEQCRGHYKNLENEYGRNTLYHRLPLPGELLTPEVNLWIHRHGGLDAALKKEIQESYY